MGKESPIVQPPAYRAGPYGRFNPGRKNWPSCGGDGGSRRARPGHRARRGRPGRQARLWLEEPRVVRRRRRVGRRLVRTSSAHPRTWYRKDERVDRPHRAGSDRPGTIRPPPLTPETPHGAAFGCGAGRRRGWDTGRSSWMETGRDRPGAPPHRDRDRRPGSGRGNISGIRGRFEAGPGALHPPVAAQRPALPRRRWAGAGVQRDLVRGLPRSGRPRGRGSREDERRGHQRDRRHHRGLPRRARAEPSPLGAGPVQSGSRSPGFARPGESSRGGAAARPAMRICRRGISTCRRRTLPVGSGMDSWSRRAGRP